MIRKRGNSWQIDVTVNGRRVRRAALTYAAACDMVLSLTHSLAGTQASVIRDSQNSSEFPMPEEIPTPENVRTMKGMLELTWLRDWAYQKDGEGSRRRSIMVLEDMGWMDLNPAEINKKHLRHLRDFYLKKDNKPATVNRKISAIQKLLATAFDEELVSQKATVPFCKEQNAITRYLLPQEEEAILQAMCELNYVAEYHLCRFLIDTGCRVGEALALRPRNIDWQKKTVLFEDTKNGTSRLLPLTDRAIDSVLKWGTVKNTNVFSQKFTRARVRAGVGAGVTPRVLRHTCASRLAQSGVTTRILQGWMGHKTLRMTARYAHLNSESLLGARDVLNDFNRK